MRRVLLDEGVPRQLAAHLSAAGLDATAFPRTWKGLADSEVLARAESAGFEVLITGDKNLRWQQDLTRRKLAVVILSTNRRSVVLARVQEIAEAASRVGFGRLVSLG